MNDAEFQSLRTKVNAIVRPEPALMAYYVITSLIATFMAPILLVPLFFRYQTLRYRFDDQGIFMGHGILFKQEMQLTYARMQDIHMSQNILERWLGIGTVTVQTAGAGAAGNMSIVGVKDFSAIRDYLYARMRGIRDGAHPALSSGGAAVSEADATLGSVREALDRTSAALEALAQRSGR